MKLTSHGSQSQSTKLLLAFVKQLHYIHSLNKSQPIDDDTIPSQYLKHGCDKNLD
jgi:hypothetical protein